MGLRSTAMVLEAKRDIRYRYVCENCDVTTEWFASAIYARENYGIKSGRFAAKMEYDPAIISKKKNKALKKLKKLTSVFINVFNDPTGEHTFSGKHALADLYNKTFSAGEACPNCNSKQSWYPMDTTHLAVIKYIKTYVLSFIFFGNLLGLIFVIAYLRVHSMPPVFILIFQLTLLVFGCLVGFVRGNYLIWKKEKTRKLISRRNVPEIIWGSPVVNALGTSELEYI